MYTFHCDWRKRRFWSCSLCEVSDQRGTFCILCYWAFKAMVQHHFRAWKSLGFVDSEVEQGFVGVSSVCCVPCCRTGGRTAPGGRTWLCPVWAAASTSAEHSVVCGLEEESQGVLQRGDVERARPSSAKSCVTVTLKCQISLWCHSFAVMASRCSITK